MKNSNLHLHFFFNQFEMRENAVEYDVAKLVHLENENCSPEGFNRNRCASRSLSLKCFHFNWGERKLINSQIKK